MSEIFFTNDEKEILEIIKKRKAYEDYFFKKVNSIKWFKELKERGYFDADKNPAPVLSDKEGFYTIPYWSALSYLEKISLKTDDKKNEEIDKELLTIIRNVTKPKNNKKVYNYRTLWVFCKILNNIPERIIKLGDIELIREWYDSKFGTTLIDSEISKNLIPKFLKSDNSASIKKAIKLLEIVTTLKINLNTKKVTTLMDEYYLSDFCKKNSDLLAEKTIPKIIEIFSSRLKELLKKKDNDDEYSYIWIPKLEEDYEKRTITEPKVLLAFLLYSILLKATLLKKDLNLILDNFFNENYLIFKRFALFIISKDYKEYNNSFWKFLNSNYFNNPNLRHELFILLRENFSNFSKFEQEKLISFIKEGPTKSGKIKKRDKALWQQRWLFAIKGQGNKEVDAFYNICKKITNIEPTLPDNEFYIYPLKWAGDETPLTSDRILSKPNIELINFFQEFKENRKFKIQSLGLSLRGAIKKDPKKFSVDLELFKELKPSFQYNLIEGFEDSWKDNKDIDWDKILNYCLKLVESENFWTSNETYEDTEIRYSSWVISSIADLILSGTQNDNRSFRIEYLPVAEKILLIILEKTKSKMESVKDALTSAINTPKGRVIMATIEYCLRYARVNFKEEVFKNKPKWSSEEIKNIFKKALDKEYTDLEFSILIGYFLPNLLWLDRDFFIKNMDKVFYKQDEKHWNVAMQGYLLHRGVYNDLYLIIKNQNNYIKSLETDFQNKEIKRLLMQHISIGYLRGLETLYDKESLFNIVLEKWNEEEIREVVSFFYFDESIHFEKELKNKVLDFWEYCFRKIDKKTTLTDADKNILSDLNLLLCLMDKINEKKQWLLQSVPYVGLNYNSTKFLKCLDKLASDNAIEVYEIYKLMLNYIVPNYDEENIISIIKKLADKLEVKFAKEIVDIYLSRDYEFVRNII